MTTGALRGIKKRFLHGAGFKCSQIQPRRFIEKIHAGIVAGNQPASLTCRTRPSRY